MRKIVIKIAKLDFCLSITNEINFQINSFLDVNLNLSTRKYQAYIKRENDPLYICVCVNFTQPTKLYQKFPQ